MGSAAAPASDSRTISLDRNSRVPFYEQLCDAVRVRIESGIYPPDYRIPTIQALADHLQVSRNTVKRAIQKLTSEGLLTGNPVSGFVVSSSPGKPSMALAQIEAELTRSQLVRPPVAQPAPAALAPVTFAPTKPMVGAPIPAAPVTVRATRPVQAAAATTAFLRPSVATPVFTSAPLWPAVPPPEKAQAQVPATLAHNPIVSAPVAPEPQPSVYVQATAVPPAAPVTAAAPVAPVAAPAPVAVAASVVPPAVSAQFGGAAAAVAPALETPASVAPPPVAAAPAPAARAPEAPSLILDSRAVPFNRVTNLEQIDLARLHTAGAPRPFRPGLPATAEFPLDVWERLRSQLLGQKSPELLEYTGTFGYLSLREAIAARLRNARGVRCSAEQVIVCAGAQQALNLVINTLVSPGDSVGLEEPGYYGVKAAFLQAGAKVSPLLVDEDGLTVPDSRRQNPPSIVYTTPANQFPLGAQLSFPRRLQLLEFARKASTWVIEDDSDGDFRYSGRPVPSLQGTDEHNRVIYLGTTGKTLFPSLEVGFIVVPLSLMESFSKTKEIMGGHASVIDQATLARFLSEGHFDQHIHRMNQIYSQRLNVLAESVDSELGDFIDLEPTNAGLHAIGWIKRGLDERVVTNSASAAGVDLPLISSYGHTALVRPGVVFGFASYTEQKIKQAVRRLSQAMRSPQTETALSYPAGPPVPQRSGFIQRLFSR